MYCFRKSLCLILMLALLVGTALSATPLDIGAQGDDVLAIQNRLYELGYTETETNGIYGSGTQAAVMLFQQYNDLLVTGLVDAVTQRVLFSEDAVRKPNIINNILDCLVEEADMYMESGAVMSMPLATGAPMPAMASMLYAQAPAFDTREYTTFGENGFVSTATSPLSTFAADVDTASWTQIRQLLLRGEGVPSDAVRIEEMLNYFKYDYREPAEGEPFGVTMELGDCPWNDQTKLLLIGLQAEKIERESEKAANLVFLIDVSGSMDEPEKLPLVKRAFLLLLDELAPTDTISIVTYASSDTIVLDGVPAGEKTRIMQAINELEAGGGTNGSKGIISAYEIAERHFVEGGNNRIILATDGDLNIGVTGEGDLARLVSEKRESGVELTVLGFGGWNYKDNRMEALADYGNGNYAYIDTIHEARRALVTEAGGTFNTVAKDVKLQLDFNPAVVRGYRLIGYEDRLLAAEDFANDAVDGGEIGSGHRVTALYELVPADSAFDFGEVQSKYAATGDGASDEWLTLSIRAKAPDGDVSTLYTYPLASPQEALPGENLRFAAGVAELGMILRNSQWAGTSSAESALTLLRGCESVTGDVYKEELVYLAGLLCR